VLLNRFIRWLGGKTPGNNAGFHTKDTEASKLNCLRYLRLLREKPFVSSHGSFACTSLLTAPKSITAAWSAGASASRNLIAASWAREKAKRSG